MAVLLVVFNHLGIPQAAGGFIGVDVFFVISGYLITGNILRSLRASTFSISAFYERRFRRIFPALAVMLSVVTLFAAWVLLPAQLLSYARSLIAAIFCSSNIFFSTAKGGYFDAGYSDLLLHTWSLGVEEQFYLVIPVGLAFLFRRGKRPTPYLLAFAIVSFLLAVPQTSTNSAVAFYWPHTRAWELLCGSLLICMTDRPVFTKAIRSALSGTALVALIAFSYFYVPAIPFPGAAALVPCLAALTLIATGTSGDGLGYRLLTAWPMPFIGAISYSLYLWHWPIIILTRLGFLPGFTTQPWMGHAFVLSISTAIAILSWHFVETPFRFGSFRRWNPRKIFFGTAVASGLLLSAGLLILSRHGYPERFSQHALSLAGTSDAPRKMREGSCFLVGGIDDFDDRSCLRQAVGKKNVLIFGDSHAAALWYGLSEVFPEVNFLQVTAATCHPTYGNYKRSNCSKLRKVFFEKYLPSTHLDAVLLTERWVETADPYDFLSAVRYFQQQNILVIVVGPSPEYAAPLPILLSLAERLRMPSIVERARVKRFDNLDTQLEARVSTMSGVRYASLIQTLCHPDGCVKYADPSREIPLLADVDHFSPAGSVMVISQLKSRGVLSF